MDHKCRKVVLNSEFVGKSGKIANNNLTNGYYMFRGITAVNIDAKGRLAIPTKYREGLLASDSGKLVMTIDTETNCLLLYPMSEWEVIESKLQALPSFNPQARRIQRLLIGHATETEMDSAGRILVSQILREYARMEKKVMLVGQGKKFELWNEAEWMNGRERWLAEETNSPETLPDEMKTLSL